MSADTAEPQMMRIQLLVGSRHVQSVVYDSRASDDERVDSQVEWGMAGGVFRG